MRTIVRFEPLSVMRIAGICYGMLGLLIGVIFSLVFTLSTTLATAGADPKMPRFIGLLFGGFAIVIFPILYGAIGALMGGLGAVVYNVTAKWLGGIRVEVL
jgi:hypothetical protein